MIVIDTLIHYTNQYYQKCTQLARKKKLGFWAAVVWTLGHLDHRIRRLGRGWVFRKGDIEYHVWRERNA